MRTSTYEIFLPLIGRDDKEIAGKTLLVNGLYGAIDVVDAEIAANIREENFAAIPFAMRERLAQRGHITRKDYEEEACNFRCPYCFERHRLTRGQEWLGHEMKPEMIEAVFAALQKQRDQGYKVGDCTLYGGEPLLKENMATVRNICEHAKAMGLSLSAITNGYDLDAYIGLLEEFGFERLQITVDGVGSLNDRRRLHRDGVPTYDRILQNVALALEHGVDISLRVNVNGDNIGGIKALIDDLAARGLHETCREERAKAGRERQEAVKAGKPVPKRKGLFSYYFNAGCHFSGGFSPC